MTPALLSVFLFAVGILLLLWGGRALVDGASALAEHWRISEHLIGLTVVAVGTSLPELTVNIFSSFQGDPQLAFGNIFGSNIANILLILGVSALIFPLRLSRTLIFSEIPFAILALLLAGFLANVPLLGGDLQGIARWEGGILLFYYVLFMLYVFRTASEDRKKDGVAAQRFVDKKPLPRKGALLRILFGILALVLGGKWVVDGSIQMASYFGMSQAFVGLTVVAVGTSLPELVTSVTAAIKRNSGIAVGNIVGSNIFNIFWVLGLSGLITPLPFQQEQNTDVVVALLATTLLLCFLPFTKKDELRWPAGLVLFLSYGAYMVFLLLRG